MKFLKIKMLAVAALFAVATVSADEVTGGKGIFIPVSMQGTAASTLGWSTSIYQPDSDELRACFKLQMEYGQNTKHEEIGKYLSPSGTDTFRVGPTATNPASTTDIAGINLLFDDAFDSGDVTFKPKSKDFVANFNMYVDLAEWCEGLYFTSQLPLQHSKRHVEITEGTPVQASAAFSTGQVSHGGTEAAIYTTVEEAFKGDKTVGNSKAWSYGKIDGERSDTRIGDALVTLGYNFVNKEHCHLGLGVTGVLGGGKKTDAEHVFAPIIGYAGRFGIGGTLDGGCRIWDKDEDHQLVANMNLYVAHLFDNEQRRSYDITDCGDFSRYLLVKKMGTTTADTYGTGTAANDTGLLDNMINVGSLRAKIGIDVIFNGNLTFTWQMGNMSLDFGYQAAGHGEEKHKNWVDTLDARTWGLYRTATANVLQTGNVDDNIQTKLLITNAANGGVAVAASAATASQFIINDRLNKDSGLMNSAVEHTVFANLNYAWMDCDWTPSVGVLGAYHFSGSDNNTFDRWSVGVQFNFCV